MTQTNHQPGCTVHAKGRVLEIVAQTGSLAIAKTLEGVHAYYIYDKKYPSDGIFIYKMWELRELLKKL